MENPEPLLFFALPGKAPPDGPEAISFSSSLTGAAWKIEKEAS
jgi:hypothetical protein